MQNIDFISAVSILLPLLAALSRFRMLDSDFKWLFGFFLVSGGIEFLAHFLKERGINNLGLGNIFFLVECFVLSIIVSRWLESKKLKLFIVIFLAAYLAAWLFTTFFVLDFHTFNNYARTMESVGFVFLSCFLLMAVSTDTSQVIFRNPKFWFGSALLIYFSVNLIVFGTVNFILSENVRLMDNTWIIHSVINIFANLLFAIGFLCIRREAI